MGHRLIYNLLLLLIVLQGRSHAQSRSVIANHTSDLEVISDAAVFIDSTNQVSIQDLLQQPSLLKAIRHNINFGRNRSTNWLMFTIRNKRSRPTHFFVYIYYPRLESIQAYALRPPQPVFAFPRTGWGIPLAQRPFPHPKNVLPITLEAGQKATIFLAVRSQYQRIIIPVSLHDHEPMLARIQIATLTDGIVSCVLLFVFIISIAYFFDSSFSEWGNLWYGLYALGTFLFYFLRFGIQYINREPLNPLLNQYVDVFTTLITLFYCLSGRSFMSDIMVSRQFTKWYAPLMIGLTLSGLFLLTLHTPSSLELAVISRIALSVVGISGLLYILIKGLIERRQYARLFFWIFIPLLVSYVTLTYATDLSNGSNDVDTDLETKAVVFIETSLMMIGFIYKNNRAKHQLKQQLAEQQAQILLTQIQTQETERQRIAADLHDDLGGTLATIRRRLADIRQHLHDPHAARQIDILEPLIQRSSHDLRRIAHNLMPPEFARIGLRSALEQLVQSQPHQPTRFSFVAAGPEYRLATDTELNLYRIVSELIQNINKHAQAARAAVQLLYHTDHLTITVDDDGLGSRAVATDESSSGLGLTSSQLRAEYIGARLWREAGEGGTLVVIDVPYPTATQSLRTEPKQANQPVSVS
ncbi:sensor histidine kinase [Rudanella lutea]|uniref:sensor histidine kinase n=1 Tax=Rudanella lutea TaxID=451374 RepID=UPI0003A9B7AC|nr:7TM-DISM domain-containing protein [Rudanella lutea]